MTTREIPAARGDVASAGRKVAAVAIWLAGVGTTYAAILSMGAPVPEALVLAAGVQLGLTMAESRIWSGRPNLLALLALAADVLLNMGGTWVWMRNVDQTPAWSMLVEAGVAGEDLHVGAKLALAATVGVLLAYLPEDIWKGGR